MFYPIKLTFNVKIWFINLWAIPGLLWKTMVTIFKWLESLLQIFLIILFIMSTTSNFILWVEILLKLKSSFFYMIIKIIWTICNLLIDLLNGSVWKVTDLSLHILKKYCNFFWLRNCICGVETSNVVKLWSLFCLVWILK